MLFWTPHFFIIPNSFLLNCNEIDNLNTNIPISKFLQLNMRNIGEMACNPPPPPAWGVKNFRVFAGGAGGRNFILVEGYIVMGLIMLGSRNFEVKIKIAQSINTF